MINGVMVNRAMIQRGRLAGTGSSACA